MAFHNLFSQALFSIPSLHQPGLFFPYTPRPEFSPSINNQASISHTHQGQSYLRVLTHMLNFLQKNTVPAGDCEDLSMFHSLFLRVKVPSQTSLLHLTLLPKEESKALCTTKDRGRASHSTRQEKVKCECLLPGRHQL